MQKLLYADLTGGTLADSLASAGGNYAWPTLIQGSNVKIGFRLVEEVEGEFVEVDREITSIRAKIGELYGQPASGTFRIWIGDENVSPVAGANLTAEIDVHASASELADALNALSVVGSGGLYGEASVTAADGSWFVVFEGETEAAPMRGVEMRTDVISFLRVWPSEQADIWTHELRIDKAGLAFADGISQEMPPAPVVSLFRVGYTPNEGEEGVNEIHKITYDSRFRGLYEVRWKGRVSALLSRDDGPEQLAEAIAGLADPGGKFEVTNPANNIALIEFAGSMASKEQPELLEIRVVDAPVGDRYVLLDLSRKTTADVLRQIEVDAADEVTLPFEIEIRYEDDADASRELIWRWQQPVTVRRQLIRACEAMVTDDDLMRPHDPRTYRPFNASQWGVGNAWYGFELGDGVADTYVIDHNLHTQAVDVRLAENQAGGRFLVPGVDYSVSYDVQGSGEDAIEIVLLGSYGANPPSAGALAGVVYGLNHVAAFQDGVTWEMGQVNGLLDALSALSGRIDALERGDFPGAAPAVSMGTGKIERALPAVWKIPRARTLPEAPSSLLGWDAFATTEKGAAPLRDIRLLPAVHRLANAVEALPTPLPAANVSYRGRVFIAAVEREDFPGGLPAGGYAACDGRDWYRVRRESDAETTWYPTLFEAELWRVSVSPDELALRTSMMLAFGFEAVLLDPSRRPDDRRTRARMSLLIERGVRASASAPATTGSNVDQQFTSPVVLVRHDFDLSSAPVQKRFSISVERSGADVITAHAANMLVAPLPVSPPDSADFVLRARICRFDVEELPVDARGIFAIRGLDVGLDGLPDSTLGKFTIS